MASPLGKKINARRRELGISLERLAELTESSKSYLWELENRDKPNPSLDKVTRIASALNLTPEALLDTNTLDSQSETDKAFFRKYQELEDKDKETVDPSGIEDPFAVERKKQTELANNMNLVEVQFTRYYTRNGALCRQIYVFD